MAISRRSVVASAAAGALAPQLAWAGDDGVGSAAPPKVLRYAFEVAETSLDPAKINDLYSRTLTPHIFEGLYTYDHLARPVKIKPLTADGMPQISDDFRVWTVRIKRGIFFAADPAFKGKRRELVAQDYVYSWKRFADPANKSPVWSGMEPEGYLGLNELRARALADKKPFDYDTEIEGIRALDRYTLRFMLKEPRPRFLETLAAGDLYGAVAREVFEFYGDQAEAHPVGTGPFKLAQWRRSSFLAFDRNPDFREMFYDAEPARRRRRGPGAAGALQGAPAADDRSRRGLDHRGGAAALARVRQRRGRRGLPGRLPVRAAGDAQRQGRAEPRQARHPRLSGGRGGGPVLPLQHGGSGRRRLQRRAGGAAPRDRPRHRFAQDHRLRLQRAGHGRRRGRRCRTRPPTTRRSRPSSATTTRRARARCSISTASSTATATAGASGPTARRWCCA